MAFEIFYPEELRITNLVLSPRNDQIVHKIEGTGGRKVFNLNPGYWVGTVEFGPIKDKVKVGKIEAFFSDLQGQDNYFNLPLNNIKLTGDIEGEVISVDGNGLPIIKQRYTDNTAWETEVGCYWVSNNRLFIKILETRNSSYFFPNIPWNVGQIIRPANHIRVRPNSNVSLPVSPHWSGGWTLQFEEYIA